MKARDLYRRPALWGARMLAKAAGYASVTTSGLTAQDDALGRFLAGGVSSSGKAVNADTAMGIAAAWSCMRILSETIGAIPWGIYERDANGNANKVTQSQLGDVLTDTPNVDMTSVEFREAEVLNLCQDGNAYSLIDRLGGDVSSLYPVASGKMRARQNVPGSRPQGISVPEGGVFFSILDRGYWEDLPREKVWHVKGFGPSGLKGLSPIAAAREAMGMSLAAEDFGNRFFSQGGKPSGFVTTEKNLTPDQRAVARQSLQTMMGGLVNAHKFSLFEGGMKPEPWEGSTLEDMLFIMVRQFGVQEVCRFYRIPPHMVADIEKGASYSSIEQMSQEFVTFTLMPYFTRFEASVSRWLMKPAERGRLFLRFNYDALLRADAKSRGEFLASMVQNGIMNRNEARAKENLGRATMKGMDDFTVQTAMAPIDKIGMAPPPALPATKSTINLALGQPHFTLHSSAVTVGGTTVEGAKVVTPAPQVTVAAPVVHVEGATLSLPDALSVTVPGLVEVAEASAEQTRELTKSIERNTAAVLLPRAAVFDKGGEPIGTKPVKKLGD